MNILEIKNVNIYYGGKEVLREINIDVKKNEILCIMGPSGCGKSTLLSLINGFLTENGGEYTGDVILKGENIKAMKPIQLRRSISYRQRLSTQKLLYRQLSSIFYHLL